MLQSGASPSVGHSRAKQRMYQGVDIARNVPLDVLPQGSAADVLHVHYRCTVLLLAAVCTSRSCSCRDTDTSSSAGWPMTVAAAHKLCICKPSLAN